MTVFNRTVLQRTPSNGR